MPNVYVLHHNRLFLGKQPKKIFAFRNVLDAKLLQKNISHNETNITSVCDKVYIIQKNPTENDMNYLMMLDLDALNKKTKMNGIDVEIIEFIIENKQKMFLVSKKQNVVYERNLELEDFQINLDIIFKKL